MNIDEDVKEAVEPLQVFRIEISLYMLHAFEVSWLMPRSTGTSRLWIDPFCGCHD